MRLVPLGSQGLWFDEVFTHNAVSGSLAHLFGVLIKDAQHPPAHYLLEWLVRRAAGSDFFLRLPSALFGTAAILLIHRLATVAAGPRAGLLAAAFLATSPFHIFYSHEARNYAMLSFISLASTWALWHASLSGRGFRVYSVWAVVGMFTSNLMVGTLAGHGSALFTYRRFGTTGEGNEGGRAPWQSWAVAAAAACAIYGLWFVAILPHAERLSPGHGDWRTVGALLIGLPLEFAIGYTRGFMPFVKPDTSPLYIGLLLLSALAAGLLMAAGVVRLRENLLARRLLVWGLALPVALALALALRTHFHQTRYAIAGLPFFLVLLASGGDWLWQRGRILVAPVALVLVMNVIGTWNYMSRPVCQRDDFRQVAALFQSRLRPDDLVIFNAAWQDITLEHYFHRPYRKKGLPRHTVPVEQQRNGDYRDQVDREVADVLRGRRRVWLVLCYDEITDQPGWVVQAMDRRARRLLRREFAGWPRPVRVILYQTNSKKPGG